MSELELVIIPDKEDPGAFIFVDGFIEKHRYRFLLDTGAASSEVCFDSYTSKFNKIGDKKSSGAFSSESLDIIQIPSIEFGLIFKTNFTIKRQSENGRNKHNIIGMDILKDYSCHFKFSTENVSINPLFNDSTNRLSLLLGPKFHPYVDVFLKETQVRAVWDTGASITVVDQAFIKRNPQLFQKIGESTGTDATGTSQETPTYMMDSYIIGAHRFPATEVVGLDLSHINSSTEIPMTMILGFTTLQYANWLFNFPEKYWAITKINKKKKF